MKRANRKTSPSEMIATEISERSRPVRPDRQIELRGGRTHNLKNIDLDVPLESFVVIAGVSGSGKSSLAFDTLFAEGQRRYIESFSASARQHLERLERPDADRIAHVPPAIAIRTDSRRSRTISTETVASMTSLDESIQRLFVRIGRIYCQHCHIEVRADSAEDIASFASQLPTGTRCQICFEAPTTDEDSERGGQKPLVQSTNDSEPSIVHRWLARGFSKAIVDELTVSLNDLATEEGSHLLQPTKPETDGSRVCLVVDRLVTGKSTPERWSESAETALREGNGRCLVLVEEPTIDEVQLTPKGDSRPNQSRACSIRQVDSRAWRQFRFHSRRECSGCGHEYLPSDMNLFSKRAANECQVCLTTNSENKSDDSGDRNSDSSPTYKLYSHSSRETTGSQGASARRDCETCLGTGIRRDALAVKVGDKNVANFLSLPVAQCLSMFKTFKHALQPVDRELSALICNDIERKLNLIVDIGLGHLNLFRNTETLSRGEVRRLMLVAALGARITGTLCVIDEPSAGLHPAEMPRLIRAIRNLVDLRNSVIVVDHAAELIAAADHVIVLGPGAGVDGGTIQFTGTNISGPNSTPPSQNSITSIGQLSAAQQSTTRTPSSRTPSGFLTFREIHHPCWNGTEQASLLKNSLSETPRALTGAAAAGKRKQETLNSLQPLTGATIKIPLGSLCVISGLGGCGKTTLAIETLYPAVARRLGFKSAETWLGTCSELTGGDKLTDAVVIDQSPLTRSARSNAATWIGVFDEIRDVFAATGEAKQRGFGSQHFSFNSAQGGSCRSCRGAGFLRHDMQFLPDVTVTCSECGGSRYRREILDVKFRGRNIAEVLKMSAAEASTFFRNHPRVQARIQMLKQIGLDYLVLGQPTDTLSSGEAQRLKLASRLTSSQGPTIIICDEPSSGLHVADIERLIACFHELIEVGHSILVVDNSPVLLQAADHVIELSRT